MTTTCLINNYNYGRYVGEAVEGALRQTAPFDEIIIVDDGSTDGSVETLRSRYAGQANVAIIAKENGGQLSCFNEGFARSSGDIVFFLDADDVYEPRYAERALEVYRREAECDFLFCGRRLFGGQQGDVLPFPDDRDLGYSVILTLLGRQWVGAATSCLSIRRAVLEEVLPLPLERDWRTRADDCLVFGASLAGARKRYLAQALVRYRVHGDNAFFGRKSRDGTARYRRRLALNRLLTHLERRLAYDRAELADFTHREFETIQRPTLGQLKAYARVSLGAPVSLTRRAACIAEMARHYVRAATRPKPATDPVATAPAEAPAILPLAPARDSAPPARRAA